MKNIAAWIAAHITIVIFAGVVLAFCLPSQLSKLSVDLISPLLGIVMFGMGLMLKPSDFKPVLKRPTDIIIGELAQFIIMPLMAWLLCRIFSLPADLTVGVILVGCCPGGTSSNVITFLAKGDVALSVGMTAVSTLLAPFVTPALVLFLAGQAIHVEVIGMFVSILQVVIFPILLGFVVSYYFRKFINGIIPYLPAISTLAIVTIVLIVVSHNATKLLSCSFVVVIVVMLHNLFGYSLGYWVAKIIKLSRPKCIAISVEVGMQNSGLATALATTHFAFYPMAAVPAVIFSAWHNISGSIIAHIYRSHDSM